MLVKTRSSCTLLKNNRQAFVLFSAVRAEHLPLDGSVTAPYSKAIPTLLFRIKG